MTSRRGNLPAMFCDCGAVWCFWGASDARKENRSLLVADHLTFISPHPVLFVVILFLNIYLNIF